MLAGLAVLVGAAIAAVLIVIVRRNAGPGDLSDRQRSILVGWTLGLGLTGLLAVGVPLLLSQLGFEGPQTAFNPALLSIAAAVAASAVGGYALARGARKGLVLLVLIPGALAVLFWLAFLVGEFLYPH